MTVLQLACRSVDEARALPPEFAEAQVKLARQRIALIRPRAIVLTDALAAELLGFPEGKAAVSRFSVTGPLFDLGAGEADNGRSYLVYPIGGYGPDILILEAPVIYAPWLLEADNLTDPRTAHLLDTLRTLPTINSTSVPTKKN